MAFQRSVQSSVASSLPRPFRSQWMDPAPVPVKRYHGIVRLAHWLNAVVLLGMIASRLQIYMAYRHLGLRDAAPLADRAVRRLRARAVLALRGRLALHRIHPSARDAGLPGGPRVVAGDDHRLVSGEVSQS